MSDGWIKLHRSILSWDWYDDPNTFRLFIHLLIRANHKDASWRGVQVSRGQLITSYASLSNELKLSVKQIRVSLTKLKKTGEVASQSNSQHTVLTVKNYDSYQSEGKPEGKRGASEGQAEGKRGATDKNEKNNKNEKKSLNTSLENTNECGGDQKSPKRKKNTYSLEFDQFWGVCLEQYKRAGDPPGNKSQAMKAWKYLRPDQDMINMIKGKLIEQASIREKSKLQGHRIDQFKHVCRWLRDSGWEDVVMPRTEPNRNNSKYPATQTTSRLMEM